MLTRRVPIIASFAPTHVGRSEDQIPFGEVYDVERLATELGFPVVEWRDVKKPKAEGQPFEAIGGWTIWARYDTIRTGLPRGNVVTETIGLGDYETSFCSLISTNLIPYKDVSYTNTPDRIKLMKDEDRDAHTSFLEVARLSTASARREAMLTEESFKSEGPLAHQLPPDEHLMVIDFSYFMGMIHYWEWEEEYFEPWRIASHAHFTPKLHSLADSYLMRHFNVETPEAIPKVRVRSFHLKQRESLMSVLHCISSS